MVGALLIRQGILGTTALALRLAIYLFGILAAAVPAMLCFTYTELNENQIANVFRMGHLVRFEHNRVLWNEVSHIEARRSTRPRTAELRITTTSGKSTIFSVSLYYEEATKRFEEIAKGFRNKNLNFKPVDHSR